MEFQKTVLIIALVILVITLVLLSAIISNKAKNKEWPPEISTCPPYYRVQTNDDGMGSTCVRVDENRKIGDDSDNCATLPLFENGKPKTFAQKREWAEGCRIKWDGIN